MRYPEVVFRPALAAAVVMLALFAGCSSPSNPSGGQGSVVMHMTDAPADYDAVNIVITEVDVHVAGADSSSGWLTFRADSGVFNLLQLRDGAEVVIDSAGLPAGHYTQIRLVLGAGSTIVVDGVTYPLIVPSGIQTGVKLNLDFDVVAGQVRFVILDFDAERSIVQTGNGRYQLKPVIRAEVEDDAGRITGVVQPASAHASIWTLADSDTVSTRADTLSGAFVLPALPVGAYAVYVHPTAGGYRDTVLASVAVQAGVTTNVGTVTLRP